MTKAMAETLRSLIDGDEDTLGEMLAPIAKHLEEEAKAAAPKSVPIMTWCGVLHTYTMLMEGDKNSRGAAPAVRDELLRVCQHTDEELAMDPTERLRLDIIRWLQWNDKNGCFTDEQCDLEEMPRIGVLTGMALIKDMIEGGEHREDHNNEGDI